MREAGLVCNVLGSGVWDVRRALMCGRFEGCGSGHWSVMCGASGSMGIWKWRGSLVECKAGVSMLVRFPSMKHALVK